MSRVAAVDCGTNSIRLLVADVTTHADGSRTVHDVHREMRIVRLGEGVDATGRLSTAALLRTKNALADYAMILRRKGAERVRMVATSATRDASNREEFFAMTGELLGSPAEVISGDEEARLSFTGAVGDLAEQDGPFVVADVGGGSTELVVGTLHGTGVTVHAARSVDIGCVRITERCLRSDPPTAEQIEEGYRLAGSVLDEAFEAVPVAEARTWIGVAGTATTMSGIAKGLRDYDPREVHLSRLSDEQIGRTASGLLAADRARRAANPVIHPGRVDVIAGGALIVDVLARRLAELAGIESMLVSEHDILDGIVLSIA